jgi:hypothetical protein
VILPYSTRLVCLCLASFFLVHLVLGLGVSLIAPVAMRLSERSDPRFAARRLLALRLFPGALACFLVIGLCVPSYLWLEPRVAAEQVRWEILIAAAFGGSIWMLSMIRGLRAIARSYRFDRYCRTAGRKTRVFGESSTVWVLQGSAPVFALAGIVHPRLVVSRAIVDALSPEQLAVGLRHERAHRTSHDNLKRLFMLCAPDILPFFPGSRALERGLAKFTEWAADDAAADGDSRRSLSLAAALVRVARLSGVAQSPSLTTSLLANGQDLQARVNRLLRDRPPRLKPTRAVSPLIAAVTSMVALALTALMLQPATLHSFHLFLEHFIQ